MDMQPDGQSASMPSASATMDMPATSSSGNSNSSSQSSTDDQSSAADMDIMNDAGKHDPFLVSQARVTDRHCRCMINRRLVS